MDGIRKRVWVCVLVLSVGVVRGQEYQQRMERLGLEVEGASQGWEGARIEVEGESEWDFGEIGESGGKVTHEFKVKNAGAGVLLLTKVIASCGCTEPEWSEAPLRSGESGSIKVTYDPSGRVGTFVKTITVYSNGEPSVLRLLIKGEVLGE
jgi:hypothetical protein